MAKNYFSEYNKKRKPAKTIFQNQKVKKVGRFVLDELSADDVLIAANIADGNPDWVAINERVATSGPVRLIMEKLGVGKEFSEFVQIVVEAGSQFQEYFASLGLKELTVAQKEEVKKGIMDLANHVDVSAKDLEQKVKKIGKSGAVTDVADAAAAILEVVQCVARVAHCAQVIDAEVKSIDQLERSMSDFTFWLERQLGKRRILQDELSQIHHLKEEMGVTDAEEVKVDQFMLRFQKDDLQKRIFGVAILRDVRAMPIKEYRKKLEEKLNKLIAIADKPQKDRKKSEQEYLDHNEELVKELLFSLHAEEGKTLNSRVLACFAARLESDHIMAKLSAREELITQCVHSKLAAEAGNSSFVEEVKGVLNKSVENKVPGFLRLEAHQEQAKKFLEFAKNPADYNGAIDHANKVKSKHEAVIKTKIEKKHKRLTAQALMLVSAGFALASAVCGLVSLFVPPAAIVLAPTMIALGGTAAIFAYAGERVSPGITDDMKKSFFHFRRKIKKHARLEKKMKNLASDSETIVSENESETIKVDPNRLTYNSQINSISPSSSEQIDFSKVHAGKQNSEEKNYFADYQKGRAPKKAKSQFKKTAQQAFDELDANDIGLVAGIVEGSADWAAIGKRLALSESVKSSFDKIGIKDEYESLMEKLAGVGAAVQKLISGMSQKKLVESQKNEVIQGISELSKGAQVDAEKLAIKVDGIGKSTKTPITDHAKNVAKIAKAVVKLGYAGYMLDAEVQAHRNAVRQKDNFAYWLTRQLVKRQQLQEEMKSIYTSSHGVLKQLDSKDRMWLDNLRGSELDVLQKGLFNVLSLSDVHALSIEEYRRQLDKKLTELLYILNQADKSQDDLEWLQANQMLLNQVCKFDLSMNEVSVKENVLVALMAHLEQEKIMGMLREKEALIQNRVMVEAADHPARQDELKKMLSNVSNETVQDTIPSAYKKGAQEFIDFAKNPAKQQTNDVLEQARKIEKAHQKNMQDKIDFREKRVISKSLLVSSAGFTLAVAVCGACVALCPPLAIVALTLAAVAAVCAFAAERVQPGVLKEVRSGFKQFHQKRKKHHALSDAMQERMEALSDAQVASSASQGASPVVPVASAVQAPAPQAPSSQQPPLQATAPVKKPVKVGLIAKFNAVVKAARFMGKSTKPVTASYSQQTEKKTRGKIVGALVSMVRTLGRFGRPEKGQPVQQDDQKPTSPSP